MLQAKTAMAALSQSLYPIAIALCLFPFVDMAGRLLPPHFENVQWRFGAVGLMFGGTLVMLVIGMTLLSFVATARKDARVLVGLSWVAFVFAAVVAAALVLFALDTLQLRSSVQTQLRQSMLQAAASAAGGAILVITALVGLGIGARRARRSLRTEVAPDKDQIAIVGA